MPDGRGAPSYTLSADVPVVILGMGRGVFHHGVLGIARSAGRLGVPVHRIGRETRAPATFSRYMTSSATLPDGAADADVLELLNGLSDRIGRALLVPADDPASVFADEFAGVLADRFMLPRQPSGLARSLSSKRGMYELCREHGVPTPLSLFPASEQEALDQADSFTFPIVVKCINAGDAPAASPRVVIAQDRDELLAAYRAMQAPDVANVMLQEHVPGTPETVWMFNGYFDADARCRVGFTGKKIRQSPPYTGATTLGVCLANPTVHDQTVRFMGALGYRGILDIGYRYDERDGAYKLLDVNPRIGATFRLFVDHQGLDVLRVMHLDLTGREIPPTSPVDGRRWIVEPLDLRSSIIYRRRGDITAGAWLRSLRGVREAAWFAADDPLPFLAMSGALVGGLPRRIRGG